MTSWRASRATTSRGSSIPTRPHTVPTYASGIHIRDAPKIIARCREEGHDAFKIKIGFDLSRDVSETLQIAESLVPDERLFADANQGWDTDQAIAYLQGVAGCPLGWLEEPIIASAPPEDWAHVRKATNTPLAGGENLAGVDNFGRAITGGAFVYLQPDLAKWGGITGCETVARRALASGVTYCPHFLGGGIGLMASAALLAAVGGRGLLEVDVNPNPSRTSFDLFAPDRPHNRLHLPQAPGLGVTTLPEEIKRYQVLHAPPDRARPQLRRSLTGGPRAQRRSWLPWPCRKRRPTARESAIGLDDSEI